MVFATVHHIHSFVCVRRQDTHISRHLSEALYVSFLSAQRECHNSCYKLLQPFFNVWMVHDQHIFTCWNIPRCPGIHRLQFLLKWHHLELTYHHSEKPVDTDGLGCFVDLVDIVVAINLMRRHAMNNLNEESFKTRAHPYEHP